MGRFKFVKAKNYKDYWIINELVEQCAEEGKDGRFRWCYAKNEHAPLPYVEHGTEAKLVVTKEEVPRIVGFYSYSSEAKRLDVVYVRPNFRGKRVSLDMLDSFLHMFPGEKELYVLNPCRTMRKNLNKHCPGRFRAVGSGDIGASFLTFEEEDLVCSNA
jgi:GNAT superfamily N-acetyltransferase